MKPRYWIWFADESRDLTEEEFADRQQDSGEDVLPYSFPTESIQDIKEAWAWQKYVWLVYPYHVWLVLDGKLAWPIETVEGPEDEA